MREYLNCDTCTAVVSINDARCEFCGSNFKSIGTAKVILKLKEEIESKIFRENISEIISHIEKSHYKNHPVIHHRKIKAMLIQYMTDDHVLDSDELIHVLKESNHLALTSEDYWDAMVLYISVLMPTHHVTFSIGDYRDVVEYLVTLGRDSQSIRDLLFEQVIVSNLGPKLYKEHKYYEDKRNFINDVNFIQKKEYLKNKYDSIIDELIKFK